MTDDELVTFDSHEGTPEEIARVKEWREVWTALLRKKPTLPKGWISHE